MSCTILQNPYTAILQAIWGIIIKVAQSTGNTLGIRRLISLNYLKSQQYEYNINGGAGNPLERLLHPDCEEGGVGMQIYIKCEGKTSEGFTFDEIALALSQGYIVGNQAVELIGELHPGTSACSIVYLVLDYGISQAGTGWILIEPSAEKEIVESILLQPSTAKIAENTVFLKTGWVYLVKAEGLNQYKIGRSKTPNIRLRELQKQSPVSLTLIHLIECKDIVAAESKLHKRFAKYRVVGEWFDLSDGDVQWIMSLTSLEGVGDA